MLDSIWSQIFFNLLQLSIAFVLALPLTGNTEREARDCVRFP